MLGGETCRGGDKPATAPAAEVVLPVPDEAAQRRALASIRQTLAADYLKTNPAGQAVLAQKLLSLGLKTQDDAAAQYMLLVEARRLALAAGDVPDALDAVEQIIHGFVVDRASWRNGTLEELSKNNGLKPGDAKVVCRLWYTAGEEAFAEEDYHTLNHCIQQAIFVANRSRDGDLQAATQAKVRRWQQVMVAYDLNKDAMARLRQDPADAKAGTIIGRFYCFYRGDWAKGLPLLAQGEDAGWRELARQDLQPHPDSAGQVQMGDAWWDAALKQENPLGTWIRQRAVYWYEKALPALSGLTAARVQGRINQASWTTAIDLLAMLNETKLQKSGWKKTAEGWVTDTNDNPLVFPYQPPEEYDYRIEFSSATDGAMVAQGLVFGERGFEWRIGDCGGSNCGINQVDGKNDYEVTNPTGTRKVAPLKADQPHTSLVRIRDKGITVVLDGKVVLDYATDYANVGQKVGNQGRLSFTIRGTGIKTLSAAEVTEITGKGTVIAEPK